MKVKYVFLGATLILLGACIKTNEHSGRILPQKGTSLALAPLPEGAIGKSRFISIFTDVCLETSLDRNSFERKARSLGLSRETDLINLSYGHPPEESPDSFDAVWITKESHASEAMLEVALRYRSSFRWETGSPSYIVSYEDGDPTMILSCTVAAVMPSLSEEDIADLEAQAANNLLTKARNRTFGDYSQGYTVTPDDVGIGIKLSKTRAYVDKREGSACPAGIGCWAHSPYQITLRAVTSRFSDQQD
ncbi:hypothetical protein [Sagittula sp. SSi028]|uniref:hypothetical protein n=1 Tax=Sagittula sp. SSi028 TaxID=3400636 RepID=UPI003AF9E6E1